MLEYHIPYHTHNPLQDTKRNRDICFKHLRSDPAFAGGAPGVGDDIARQHPQLPGHDRLRRAAASHP